MKKSVRDNAAATLRRAVDAATAGLLVALAWPATPVVAAADTGERIVFESDRGGHSDLWTVRPDGSDQQRLTDDSVDDVFPSWSPDGTMIAWTRGGLGPEGEIWVMARDGSHRTRLTFNEYSDAGATWSPDGTRIAFRSTRSGNTDIYVMNADGSGERRLTTDPGREFGASWSPDGTRIAFTRDSDGTCAIHTVDITGDDERQITPASLAAAIPRWSPVSGQILFTEGFCSFAESDLFMVDADGSGLTQITDTPENEIGGGWSADGRSVVADLSRLVPGDARPEDGQGGHLHKGDVAVVDVSSGVVMNLTSTRNINEGHPDWS